MTAPEDDAMASAQLKKIRAEIRKLSLESERLMQETRWYPMIVTAGLFAAIGTVIKVFFD